MQSGGLAGAMQKAELCPTRKYLRNISGKLVRMVRYYPHPNLVWGPRGIDLESLREWGGDNDWSKSEILAAVEAEGTEPRRDGEQRFSVTTEGSKTWVKVAPAQKDHGWSSSSWGGWKSWNWDDDELGARLDWPKELPAKVVLKARQGIQDEEDGKKEPPAEKDDDELGARLDWPKKLPTKTATKPPAADVGTEVDKLDDPQNSPPTKAMSPSAKAAMQTLTKSLAKSAMPSPSSSHSTPPPESPSPKATMETLTNSLANSAMPSPSSSYSSSSSHSSPPPERVAAEQAAMAAVPPTLLQASAKVGVARQPPVKPPKSKQPTQPKSKQPTQPNSKQPTQPKTKQPAQPRSKQPAQKMQAKSAAATKAEAKAKAAAAQAVAKAADAAAKSAEGKAKSCSKRQNDDEPKAPAKKAKAGGGCKSDPPPRTGEMINVDDSPIEKPEEKEDVSEKEEVCENKGRKTDDFLFSDVDYGDG